MYVSHHVAQFILEFVNLYEILILIRCVLSFLPLNIDGTIIRFLYSITEFLLAPIRAVLDKTPIGPSRIMLDFSPLLAILILDAAVFFLRI